MAAAIQIYFIAQKLSSLTTVEQRKKGIDVHDMVTQSIEPEE